jgi:hypothetical protein
MEAIKNAVSYIINLLPACNTMIGIFFYAFVTYLVFLLMLRLTSMSDKDLKVECEKENNKFNQKLEEARKIKGKEAKELLDKISKMN